MRSRTAPPKAKFRAGVAWEKSLDAQHAIYRQAGVADIEKIPTPMRPLSAPYTSQKKRQVVTAAFEPRRHVDFIGVLCTENSLGKAVRIEAKEVRGNGAVPLARVNESQTNSLRRCHMMGGFAAVAVCYKTGAFLVPFVNWRPGAYGNGRPIYSLNAELLASRGAQFLTSEQALSVLKGHVSVADWLSVAISKGWI